MCSGRVSFFCKKFVPEEKKTITEPFTCAHRYQEEDSIRYFTSLLIERSIYTQIKHYDLPTACSLKASLTCPQPRAQRKNRQMIYFETSKTVDRVNSKSGILTVE